MAKAGFSAFVEGLLEMGKVGVAAAAQHQQTQDGQRKRRKKGDGSSCTPCAAKAKGADLANGIWK